LVYAAKGGILAMNPSLPRIASIQEFNVPPPEQPRSSTVSLFETCLVGKLPISRVRMPEAVDAVIRHVRQVKEERSIGRTIHLFGVNAQVAVLAREDERFAQAMLSSHLLYPDGISIVMASRFLGRPLIERIPGSELMELLCYEGAKEGLSAYFLGGLPLAAEKTALTLKERYPGLVIAGHCCPRLGFETDREESAQLLKTIQDAAPDMLFVGLGAPKQEHWIFNNSAVLPLGVAVPVGAALDTISGYRKRAPVWARRAGLEWFYRLVREPRRLWRRYLIGNTRFVLMVFTQWMQERKQKTS
jgi:N-acetylglucosaminyldiphosphoundecaprenol N-acetyl-beta-D-mannosaminyltransferase